MNRVLEEFKIPGYKTRAIIVPRVEGTRKNEKGNNKQTLQLELDLNSD
jgi:hypothetical protein